MAPWAVTQRMRWEIEAVGMFPSKAGLSLRSFWHLTCPGFLLLEVFWARFAGRTPKDDPGYSGEIRSLDCLGNTLMFLWKSWSRWLRRRKSSPHNLDKWQKMDGWHCLVTNTTFHKIKRRTKSNPLPTATFPWLLLLTVLTSSATVTTAAKPLLVSISDGEGLLLDHPAPSTGKMIKGGSRWFIMWLLLNSQSPGAGIARWSRSTGLIVSWGNSMSVFLVFLSYPNKG